MATPIIQVQNLVKHYGDFQAVKGISFEVYENEIFGLLGPNGAGKTTTLEIIETLRDETEGEVIVGGYSVNNQPLKVKSIIGVQLQEAGFYPHLKLINIIEMFAGLYGVRVNAMELLQMVELGDKAQSLVEELSGGQKQRFSIATTMVNKPKVIFLDEPTTGLDPQARRNLWDLIKNLRSTGTTVVMTTHYMEEAEYLCDRVAIIDQGKILKLDTPQNLITELIDGGFKKPQEVKQANLEDVFLDLTGRDLREE